MAKVKAATQTFDPVRFGRILREKRRIEGYSNTRQFSDAILDKTQTFIDSDTLLKYERGEREPDVSKLVAIATTLFGGGWDSKLMEILRDSIPRESNSTYTLATSLQSSIDDLKRLNKERALRDELSKAIFISDALGIPFSEAKQLLAVPEIKKLLNEHQLISESNDETNHLTDFAQIFIDKLSSGQDIEESEIPDFLMDEYNAIKDTNSAV